ncbi:MAG: hypothetical protein ACE5D7_02290 [Fidelibacterota bacterium]
MIASSTGCNKPITKPSDNIQLLPTAFPDDFVVPRDFVTGNPLLGWGGGKGEITHTPIVFVHGNGHSANNWKTMATYFAKAGYTWNELWAISYLQAVEDENYNSNEGNWAEIDSFVASVLAYTGVNQVQIISHSLGVTVARSWLKHADDYNQVRSFVAIAGANHGVSFCGPDDHRGMCGELGNPESDWLKWLNSNDETPHDNTITWISIFNGSNRDIFFPIDALMNDGSVKDLRQSPSLEGAINITFPDLDHINLGTAEIVFDTIASYLNE